MAGEDLPLPDDLKPGSAGDRTDAVLKTTERYREMNSNLPHPETLTDSAALYRRALDVMPGGNTRSTAYESPHPLYLASGSGAYVRDVDGRQYLDLQNNFTTLIHGHCHAATVEALQRQLSLGTCFSNPTQAEVELAEILCERVPHFEHLRFMNTGTEAVMTAIKAARALTGRAKVAKCEGAYHGSYDLAEVSLDSTPETWGEDRPRQVALNIGTPRSVLEEAVVLPFNDVSATEEILTAALPDLAAILIDPMPSRMGLVAAQGEYLAFLSDFAKRHEVILISDEVLNFRLGYHGAAAELGFEPDLTTFGKIVGGGLPIGAVAGRREAMAVFDPSKGKPWVSHAGTFTANPMSMVAGIAAMRAMTPEAFDRLNALGELARRGLQQAFEDSGVAGQVTGQGSLFLFHLKTAELRSYRAAYRDPAERARILGLVQRIRDRGVLLSPIGLGALSTSMTSEDVNRLVEAARHALRHLDS